MAAATVGGVLAKASVHVSADGVDHCSGLCNFSQPFSCGALNTCGLMFHGKLRLRNNRIEKAASWYFILIVLLPFAEDELSSAASRR